MFSYDPLAQDLKLLQLLSLITSIFYTLVLKLVTMQLSFALRPKAAENVLFCKPPDRVAKRLFYTSNSSWLRSRAPWRHCFRDSLRRNRCNLMGHRSCFHLPLSSPSSAQLHEWRSWRVQSKHSKVLFANFCADLESSAVIFYSKQRFLIHSINLDMQSHGCIRVNCSLFVSVSCFHNNVEPEWEAEFVSGY